MLAFPNLASGYGGPRDRLFLSRLDITVEVDDSAASSQVLFGFELYATLLNKQ